MPDEDYSPSSSTATIAAATPPQILETSADGPVTQHDVYGSLDRLHMALEMILSYLIDIRDHWAKAAVRGESYGLERAAHSLSAECEKLKALQTATYGQPSYGQLAIWSVVQVVLDRCLGKAADPLNEYLRQSLNGDDGQSITGSRFLHLLKGYDGIIRSLDSHSELLCVLRTALELAKDIFEAEQARQENRIQDSENSRNALQKAEFGAYKAADSLKRYTDQLRYRRSTTDPCVHGVIEATNEIRNLWRSMSRNMHFTERAPGNNFFVGQKEQLEKIRKAFEQPDSPSSAQKRFVIQGMPGSGKSELALRYAIEHRGQFWGVFWVDASSETNSTRSYIEMAKVFGVNLTEQAARHHLSTRHQIHPWLLIIDNADDEGLSLDHLVPPGDNGHVIVTTRDPSKIVFGTAGQTGHLRLSSMREEDASDLLLAAAQYKKEDQGGGVLRDVANICQQLHYLPLALVHAGKAIHHHALKMREYMSYFRKEANIIRERWRRRYSNQNSSPQTGISDTHAYHYDDDNMSVFASFELLTFSQLNRLGDERFLDAIQLLQIISFMDFQNIRVDFFTQAALNPIREVIKQNEMRKKEIEVIQRLGLGPRVSWTQALQWGIQAASGLSYPPPVLPEALKNPRNLDADDLRDQIETRVRSALRVLASRSLIARASRLDKPIENDEKSMSDHENDEDYVDVYSMHPLVHQWVRERPSLSVAEQALFCEYALTVLSNSVIIVGGNDDADMAFRRALKPHIDKALEFKKVAQNRINRNLARGKHDWWFKRWARWAVQLSSGPSQMRAQIVQYAKFGKVFLECGSYTDAHNLLSQVHDYLIQRLGPDHQLSHQAKLGLAAALLLQTKRKESTKLLRLVYSSRVKTLGKKHPQTLEITTQLAESVLALGRISESMGLCNQAFTGLKQAYGDYHRKTIHCVHLIGGVYFYYNDFDKCLSQHREVLRLVQESTEEGDGAVSELEVLVYQEHLAGILFTMSRNMPELEREEYLSEADELSEHVVMRRHRILGQWHPLTLYGRAQRGRILAMRWQREPGRLAEIAKMMYETLEVAQKGLGDGHLGILSGKGWYAEILILQGRLDEAEMYLREACNKEKYSEASDIDGEHPDRILRVWELAQLLESKGSLQEALSLCRELEVNIQHVGGHGLGPSHRFNRRLLQKLEALELQLRD